MTQTILRRNSARIALSFSLLISLSIAASNLSAKDKRAAKKPAAARSAKAERNDKRTRAEQRGRDTRSARNERGRDARLSKAERARADREARVDKRRDKASAREQRAARKEESLRDRKGNRAQSRRERLLEARRAAEQRAREIAEARRRAELARQAAIARQRAADQALRDETAANIARDETTGEDAEVRRAAVAALGSNAGTVVVMDPKTGRVYTVVNQEWALRRGYKPCSTIKLVTGLAGISENVIAPEQVDTLAVGRVRLDLTDSLAYSNNGYFQSVGGRVGFDRMMSYARELGLGERTGINHANEFTGRVPAYKSGYAVNHMSSHGDDFEVTPIQLGALVSTIANGGTLLTPHLPRTPQEDAKFKTESRRRVSISPEALRRMIPGMIGAASYGTGKLAYDPIMQVAGKTGTCIGQGSWLGLFTSYAPVADPRLAVVVVTRGSGARGRVAAAIAGKVYRSLDYRFGKINGGQLATTPESLKPHPRIDAKTAAAVSDEDREDETEGVDDAATSGGASKVKSVIMTFPRPTEMTTRPNQASGNAPTPAQRNEERPRRVLTNQP
ncbi:MAG TPA: penicillin-binding transpeptidase domain-containing protein [Pyrinomonadaceae bacterium]